MTLWNGVHTNFTGLNGNLRPLGYFQSCTMKSNDHVLQKKRQNILLSIVLLYIKHII